MFFGILKYLKMSVTRCKRPDKH